MKPPRPPDWLIYVGVVAALTWAAIAFQERADAPPAPPPMPGLAGAPLGPASPFDPSVVVKAPTTPGPGTGTAFSVAASGVWLTARHVVDGCARTAIVVGPGSAVAAAVRIDPRGDTAVLFTRGGAPPVPLAPPTLALRQGAAAFHPGFPLGRAGEAASRLVGRERLVTRGRGGLAQQVLAWAEVGRTADLPQSLAGLSGAPALDSAGRAFGFTIAQAPRRGLIYTTTPRSLRAALAAGGVSLTAAGVGEPITMGTYGRVADDLRRDLRVVPVVCLD
jgi:serine protease Do